MVLRLFKHLLALLTICFCINSNIVGATFLTGDREDGIWQIGVEGTYLWQSDNTIELDSSTQTQFEPAFASPIVDKTLDPNWGGGINIGYVFPYHHYDIQFSYNFVKQNQTFYGDVPVNINGNIPSPVASHTEVDVNFEAADLLLGTYFSPTEHWLLRLGYGLDFVRIKQRSDSIFNNRGSDLGFPHTTHVNDTHSKTRYTGLGPKLSLNSNFHFLRDFYFVGDVGVSVLYGESESQLYVTGLIINHSPVTPPHNFSETNYQAALGFEGKLGLAYVAEYSDDIALSIEGGFLGQSYINAMQDKDLQIDLTTDGNTTQLDFDGDYSNFGPYVNLTLNYM